MPLFAVVVSGDSNDASADAFEAELALVREDLVDSLNAWVVKAVESKLKERFSPDKGPLVVFFRKQVPVLYQGKKK